ncbi:hypothetical protein M2232_009274 [Bradyrhizobium japonicum]|uniref:hypothetical protein n=1 Tax=Bradyrhizobium japonicum TaxID=375 RepID=UPI002226C0DC|nr:hypothetical protein [Bradyrhizobium japonicum]MCW2225742.1 hypothetical protein [Bradyrhizobium japonicum]MCW2340954.1 hypothetical protein [Bradyrhizobium japonicum]
MTEKRNRKRPAGSFADRLASDAVRLLEQASRLEPGGARGASEESASQQDGAGINARLITPASRLPI